MTIHHKLPRSPNDLTAAEMMSPAASSSTWKSPSHAHSHSRSRSSTKTSRSSTTPRGYPNVVSVGQSMPPKLSPIARSPQPARNPKSSSPSYFGFVSTEDDSIPPDSNPGHHARQNWNFPGASSQESIPTPRPIPVESNPEFEAFRRKSEQHRFNLSQNLSGFTRPSQHRTHSAITPSPNKESNKKPMLERAASSTASFRTDGLRLNGKDGFDIPRTDSPAAIDPNQSVADHQSARLSLPNNELQPPPLFARKTQRSETVPPLTENLTPAMISPVAIAELLSSGEDMLILDIRVYQQYATSRIQGALNLCIPTTLLKRPSFTVQKLAETFSSNHDRRLFDKWPAAKYIIVYDNTSVQAKEAVTAMNVLKKFAVEGWTGNGVVVKGGFVAFAKTIPEFVDRGPVSSQKSTAGSPLSISPPSKDVLPVAGGCHMPDTSSAANPFFGNIRQNMDLLDGVGQIPVKRPIDMTQQSEAALPAWLQTACVSSDEGKLVSKRFLSIEKSEQKRMQEALSTKVSYGTPSQERPRNVQIAGIEKGSKNRYNNIFPYDHSRVRLQNVSQGDCDYVNASFVQAEYSNRQYIATQAPVPATFNDFWRVVWEQDVRVIVMLTAESEGGQVKSHTYWNTGDYGPLKLKKLSERQASLDSKNSNKSASSRPTMGQRRSTTNNVAGERIMSELKPPTNESSHVTVRHFTLSHSHYPFEPMREITQLQFAEWPDFGAPANPSTILNLIEQVNKFVRGCASPGALLGPQDAMPPGQRPIVVHCSAGCGRTGTFCTIDSVIDMLKRQKIERDQEDVERMEVDAQDDWVSHDDVDLVAKTVDDFRRQRLSMVQNLRQFVLCYESILQWELTQQPDSIKIGKDSIRRSYQG